MNKEEKKAFRSSLKSIGLNAFVSFKSYLSGDLITIKLKGTSKQSGEKLAFSDLSPDFQDLIKKIVPTDKNAAMESAYHDLHSYGHLIVVYAY